MEDPQKKIRLSGRCLCGETTYSYEGPLLFTSLCYCQDCRRWSGSGHLPVVGVLKSELRVSGQPKAYALRGGSGEMATRHFCGSCGSSLFGYPGVPADAASIYCGSLDESAFFAPAVAVNTQGRPGWSKLAVTCTEFARMPPRAGA